MPSLDILPVEDKASLRTFVTFPWQVYRGDPHWVPMLVSERLAFLDPAENPFFQHARAQFYIARRGGRVAGTIGAFTNDLYNGFQGTNVGFFGFFEVMDDPEAAAALLATAETWAGEAGHSSILGPAQFSTNDEAGLLVDGFDDAPRVLMTYNPPRYREYLEAAGYEKAMDLWAYSISLQSANGAVELPAKLRRVADKVRKRGRFHVRRLNMKRFDEEVERVMSVYNQSWAHNWGFVPMTGAEFHRLAEQLKVIIDPDLVIFVEAEGEIVGFVLSLPDLNGPLRLAYPRPGTPEFLTTLKLAWHWKVRRKATWLRVFTLGVLPEYRGKGIDALLVVEAADTALQKGFRAIEMSWILENNDMMNRSARFGGGEVYKTYRMYQKSLQ